MASNVRPLPNAAAQSADVPRDHRGYYIPERPKCDTTKLSGKIMERVCKANEASDEQQRRLGYKVYEGDPGKDPFYAWQQDVRQIQGAGWSELFCTLL